MLMRDAIVAWSVLSAFTVQPSDSPQSPGLKYKPEVTLQIGVASLDRSIKFYVDVLGFRLTERRDDLKFAHIATNVPGLELGLSEMPSPAPSTSVVVNISVDDVAAARAALEAKGVKFPRPTQVIPGKVALAEFADPDGHRLRLAGTPAGAAPDHGRF